MTGERLISEAEFARCVDERGNTNGELGAEPEANRRQNCALQDDVSNAHCSSIANPLRLGTHEETREDVVSEKEISAIRRNRGGITERDLAGLLGKGRSG